MFPTIKLNIERWKYNPTFELYVSNMGHIRNKSKADIAPKVAPSGYLAVKVHGSINAYMLLHRVVMLTWKPTPEAEELTVDHLDHNKRNNALSNLEWVVAKENFRRAREDFLNANDVIDHHLVEAHVDPKKITSLLVSLRKEQYPTLNEQYVFANLGEIMEFLASKKAAGESSMVAWGPKAREKLKRKYNAILGGCNPTGQASYMGITITPITNDGTAVK